MVYYVILLLVVVAPGTGGAPVWTAFASESKRNLKLEKFLDNHFNFICGMLSNKTRGNFTFNVL